MYHKKLATYLIILLSPVLFAVVILLSIRYGATDTSFKDIFAAIFHYDQENMQQTIVRTSRIPRAVGALLIGVLLAVSGALMQGITRNYLASPSIMGVTDGSAFFITISFIFLPNLSSFQLLCLSFLGSMFGVALVMGLAAFVKNGYSPVKLAIIGTIIGTFLSGVSSSLASYFQVSQTMSFWYNARLHQIDLNLLTFVIPFGIIGIIIAILLSKSVTILSLGKDLATGLGQETRWIQLLSMAAVGLMTGISVALVGKIGFIGLIIPHITRFLVGSDYRAVIPCAGILGGVFLVFCDVISRFVNYPFETPIGIITSIIGVPFFLYLIKRKGGGSQRV